MKGLRYVELIVSNASVEELARKYPETHDFLDFSRHVPATGKASLRRDLVYETLVALDDKLYLEVWACVCKWVCNHEVLVFLFKRSTAKGRLEYSEDWIGVAGVLLDLKKADVLEQLLRDKDLTLDLKFKKSNTTGKEYIMRLTDEDLKRRLLKAGRSRARDDHSKPAYADMPDWLGGDDPFDLFVVLGDQEEVGFHRSIVKRRSEYFKHMVESGMLEVQGNRVTLQGDDISVNALLWVRNAMYKGHTTDHPNDDIFMEVLHAVDYFGIGFLAQQLAQYVEGHLEDDNFWNICQVSYHLDCQELIEACVDYVRGNDQLTKKLINAEEAMENSQAVVFFLRAAVK